MARRFKPAKPSALNKKLFFCCCCCHMCTSLSLSLARSFPFYHQYLQYQMPKRLGSLVDLVNGLGLDQTTLTSVLSTVTVSSRSYIRTCCPDISVGRCGARLLDNLGVHQLQTRVSHALKIARVRQHVQRLLSNRHFVKAGLEKKSWWILECPEAPPLRLIHWSKIAAAGQLPKYNVDSGGATSVDKLLDEVEEPKLQQFFTHVF